MALIVPSTALIEPGLLSARHMPIGPVRLDRQVETTRGMTAYYVLRGRQPRDLVTNQITIDDIGAGVGYGSGQYGPALQTFPAANEYARFSTEYVVTGAQTWSLGVGFDVLEDNAKFDQVLGGNRAVDSTLSRVQFYSDANMRFHPDSGTTINLTFDVGLFQARYKTIIFTFSGGIFAGYFNGIVPSITDTAGAEEIWRVSALMAGSTFTGATYHYRANWHWFAMWDRVISQGEAQRLHYDPGHVLTI